MFPTPTKRLVRSKSGLKIVTNSDRSNIPWHLEEPHWVKDEECAQCIQCKAKFDFVKRRHHCRRCGKIFCGRCCHTKVQFHRMGFVDPVRLCSLCAAVTRREQQFFDSGLKALLTGAPFHVRSSATIAGDSPLYSVRLSQDERSLVFEAHDAADGGGGEDLGPVELTRIVQVVPGEDGDDKEFTVSFRVRETATDDLQLWLECPKEPSRKPSANWIEAFNRGMTMVFESRSICRDDDGAENVGSEQT